MKKITVFILVFLLILSVNGNAVEMPTLDLELYDISSYIVPYDLEFLDDTSSFEEFYNHIIRITSWPEFNQGWRAVFEPITMLILGTGLLGLGVLGRKRLKK